MVFFGVKFLPAGVPSAFTTGKLLLEVPVQLARPRIVSVATMVVAKKVFMVVAVTSIPRERLCIRTLHVFHAHLQNLRDAHGHQKVLKAVCLCNLEQVWVVDLHHMTQFVMW